jgi:ADP-ribose pyrophosphatase YjhB (NUDIX family)
MSTSLRYANLVYLIDDSANFAVIYHEQYKRWIPCGSRLEPYEMPHKAVHRAVLEEVGFNQDRYDFWPQHTPTQIGDTEIVPRPYQVQLEKGNHRGGIQYHYDFVYVCRVPGVEPQPSDTAKTKLWKDGRARWLSFEELEKERTFPDVLVTARKILDEMKSTSGPAA